MPFPRRKKFIEKLANEKERSGRQPKLFPWMKGVKKMAEKTWLEELADLEPEDGVFAVPKEFIKPDGTLDVDKLKKQTEENLKRSRKKKGGRGTVTSPGGSKRDRRQQDRTDPTNRKRFMMSEGGGDFTMSKKKTTIHLIEGVPSDKDLEDLADTLYSESNKGDLEEDEKSTKGKEGKDSDRKAK